jgi:tRNA 2-thiocytidine biosynthesis protein TtcA
MKHKTLAQIVDGLIVKAIKKWNMINSGDRILIAVSGGKDSSILVRDLTNKKKQGRLDAELSAIYIHGDFSQNQVSALASILDEYDIPFTSINIPDRLKAGRSMNCYWCSTQRRTELIKFALANNFTSIALGHHLDDVLETLFMNMINKSLLATMPPVLHYINYPLKIIRPLYLVEEMQIQKLVDELGLVHFTCNCPYNANSERDHIRSRIEQLTNGLPDVKRRLLESLSNIKVAYLP